MCLAGVFYNSSACFDSGVMICLDTLICRPVLSQAPAKAGTHLVSSSNFSFQLRCQRKIKFVWMRSKPDRLDSYSACMFVGVLAQKDQISHLEEALFFRQGYRRS